MELTRQKLKKLLLEQAESIGVSIDFVNEASDFFSKYFVKNIFRVPSKREISFNNKGKIQSSSFICLIQPDKPFIINSIIILLTKYGIKPRALLHPILKSGEFENLPYDVSIVYISLDRKLAEIEQAAVQKELNHISDLNQKVVDNFKDMRLQVLNLTETVGKKQNLTGPENDAIASFHWFLDDNFIFQGWARYEISNNTISKAPSPSDLLGICNDSDEEIWNDLDSIRKAYNNKVFKHLKGVIIEKSAYASKIHRNALIDLIIYIDEDLGELNVFLGLRTSKANFTSIGKLPFLADKIKTLSKALNFETKGSAGENFFRNNLNEFTWEGLTRQDDKQLVETFSKIMVLSVFPSPKIFFFKHSFLERLQALVILPKDYYSTEISKKVSNFLIRELQLRNYNQKAILSGDAFARLVFDFEILGKPKSFTPAIEYLEKSILKLAKSWEEEYRGYISERNLIAEKFPKKYRVEHSPMSAIPDGVLIGLARKKGVSLALDLTSKDGVVIIKMAIRSEETPALTDTLPIFERCQISIRDESYYRIESTGKTVYLIYFTLNTSSLTKEEYSLLESNGSNLLDTIAYVWNNQQDNDYFNALSWKAGLYSNQIELLRTLSTWLKQTKTILDSQAIALVLAKYPSIANELISLFYGLFEDTGKRRTPLQIETLLTWYDTQTEAMLNDIKSRNEDSMIRNLFLSVKCCVRTNYFFKNISDPLVIKFKTQDISFVVNPKPYREIFIYSRNYEGIHLRFGAISRGGIRWSDRIDDYRTEILGLAKAQRVKNAVIVPTGAKGGFVVKNPKISGIEAYKSFITALLSVTDNIVDEKNINSTAYSEYDVFDPYLVVAADKGTAKFSDTANSIALAENFWLNDAFASGGKNGYDHKILGITAKGAWVSAKRHFYEIGINPYKDPITVIAIGDMGGDVFGNGLLESESIRLIAAFNHAHIFIDPDPDPKLSYQARKNLFNAKKAGWDSYPDDKLSKGGKIYSRDTKSVILSNQIQKKLATAISKISPDELIAHLLRVKVDLLYFAGIGTFVKSSHETNFEVSDTNNDYIRINADEIGARVVVEGANLGMTQEARIEYATGGGRVNTDSLDNLAGVTCSDYEVNIKILLNQLVVDKKLTVAKRNSVLSQVEQEVVSFVLSSNYNTGLAISMVERRGSNVIEMLKNITRRLELAKKLDRRLENLPSDQELDVRLSQNKGLYRPELTILLSYVKIDVKEKILAMKKAIPEEIYSKYLIEYFPLKLQKNYAKEIKKHRLSFEIFVNLMVNSAINRLGMSFFYNINRWTLAEDHVIIIAYAIARDQLRVKAFWDQLKENESSMSADLYYEQLAIISQIVIELAITLSLQLVSNNLSKIFNFFVANKNDIPKLFSKVTKKTHVNKILTDFLSIKKERISRLEITDKNKDNLLNLEVLRLSNMIFLEAKQFGLEYEKFLVLFLTLGTNHSIEKLRILLSEANTGELWSDRNSELNYIEVGVLHKKITAKLLKKNYYDIPSSPLLERYSSVIAEINFLKIPDSNSLAVAVQLLARIEQSL